MAGPHYQCSEHELGQTPGGGEEQGCLACYSPWGHKELDMTWWLKNNNDNSYLEYICHALKQTQVKTIIIFYLSASLITLLFKPPLKISTEITIFLSTVAFVIMHSLFFSFINQPVLNIELSKKFTQELLMEKPKKLFGQSNTCYM